MNNDDKSNENGIKIDIGQISSAGHVVIAGRDAHVSGATGGDTVEENIVTIGGVEATPEEVKALNTSFDKIEKTIEQAPLDPNSFEAAKFHASTLRKEMGSEKKPNEHLLVQATEALLEFGPDIAGSVVAAFTTPIAGKIVAYAGERALKMYRKLRGFDQDS